ncbi:hypothetical protein BGP77_08225 [Saccharospirillum sp. MSK14-1]|uniref:chain length-determining protein n=1 Tax=Saccharospirillum sp. MSK14-1 TaxID=1897632 RepID=UPI000D3888F7|nr:chain length-determining protein [Saccharospirillum sp. MSK14-1]PTY35754.1 hypothetical protein BGP77_08225 [Saccharospirillum sp. MSK14-1]
MDPTNIREFLIAIKIELIRYRYLIIVSFIVISAGVLAAGFTLPKTYSSRVVLYADVTNIIGSLLEGTAEITNIDRAKEARDIIFTDRILRSVARKAEFEDADAAVGSLRSKMKISANGDYVDISYTSANRDRSFNVIDAVTQSFLAETARKKREESQSAFEFIDAQVNSYKSQLEDAEQKLKEFSALNIDITEQSVANRVINYKNAIQILELEIEDTQARLASFEEQLQRESEFLQIETERQETFEERQLEAFERQLAELRLSYLDTHPDIISLQDQIKILQVKVDEIVAAAAEKKTFMQIENPSFTNLKEVINNERADLTAKENRRSNTSRLLQAELANAETVAEKQATYQELTRDYAVTKGVYEDMLKRRESARLSMTLDIEGQGVSYKIHEPASYPLHSNGLQLKHYALIGPVFGVAIPFGLVALLVLMDSRIRSATFMSDNLPSHINLITSIPMYDGAIAEFTSKRGLLLLGILFSAYMVLYVTISSGTLALSAFGISL